MSNIANIFLNEINRDDIVKELICVLARWYCLYAIITYTARSDLADKK